MLSRSKNLGQSVLVVDGLGGSGKALLSSTLMAFDRLEPVSVFYYLDYIIAAQRIGRITFSDALALCRLILDVRLYENLAGREVNFRNSDVSSVNKTHKKKEMWDRLERPDGPKIIERMNKIRPIQHIMTHNSMTNVALLDEACGSDFIFLEMVRSPLYTARHLAAYADRYGDDPRDFTLWTKSGDFEVPWFAMEPAANFQKLCAYDKAISCIINCNRLTQQSIAKHHFKGRYYRVYFENFVSNPYPLFEELDRVVGGLNKSRQDVIFKQEKIPRSLSTDAPSGMWETMYNEILPTSTATAKSEETRYIGIARANATTPFLERLLDISEKYETERSNLGQSTFQLLSQN